MGGHSSSKSPESDCAPASLDALRLVKGGGRQGQGQGGQGMQRRQPPPRRSGRDKLASAAADTAAPDAAQASPKKQAREKRTWVGEKALLPPPSRSGKQGTKSALFECVVFSP